MGFSGRCAKKTIDSVLFVKKSGIKKAARSFIKQDESNGV